VIEALVDTGKPGDVALFGRMMPVNVDAAILEMAHAIGINLPYSEDLTFSRSR